MFTDDLRDDQRGGVLVLGVVMGGILCCALWYLISVSKAILAQEELQAAADAMAFQTAVWHARGMNVLSIINMAMAVVLTIIVAIRVVELVLLVILVVCAVVTAPTGVLEVICAGISVPSLTAIVELERKVAKPVTAALMVATAAEAAVAIAVPYLATGKGLAKTSEFYKARGVTDHNAFSLSLLPTSIDATIVITTELRKKWPKVTAKKQGGSKAKEGEAADPNNLIEPRIGWYGAAGAGLAGAAKAVLTESTAPLVDSVTSGWPSLPAEGDGVEQLCSRTGEFAQTMQKSNDIPSMVMELLGPALLPEQAMKEMNQGDQALRMLAGDFWGISLVSSLLCQPIDSVAKSLIGVIGKIPEKLAGPLANLLPQTKKVTEVLEKVEAELAKTSKDGKESKGPDLDKVKPAKLWSLASNGSIFLRTWASVGREAQSRWAFASDPTPKPGQAVASAEYYASCFKDALPDWMPETLKRDCADDAMWRIGWSARMRRVRPIAQELDAEELGKTLIGNFLGMLAPFQDSIPTQNLLNWLIGDDDSPLNASIGEVAGDFADTWLVKWVEGLVSPKQDAADAGRVIH